MVTQPHTNQISFTFSCRGRWGSSFSTMCGQALSITSSRHTAMPWTHITPHTVTHGVWPVWPPQLASTQPSPEYTHTHTHTMFLHDVRTGPVYPIQRARHHALNTHHTTCSYTVQIWKRETSYKPLSTARLPVCVERTTARSHSSLNHLKLKNKQTWQTSLTERTASFVPRPKLHMITSLFPAQCCASCWKYFCSKMSFAAHYNLPTASIALCSLENMTWQLSHHNLLLLTCVTL